MNPNPEFRQSRFFRFLDETQEVVENIDEVASEVLNIQETSAEIVVQSQALRNAIAGVDEQGNPLPTPPDPPENVPTSEAEAVARDESRGAQITPTDERQPVEAGAS
jgi:hypothetical protein